jgi:hypothetical protein
MPVWRIALYGFLLNMLWEFVQCTVLYDMWSWGLWRGTAWMWGGIAGDVVIVLGVVGLSRLAVGAGPLLDLSLKGWVALLGVGFVASVALEWAARALGLWGYTSWMPTLTIGGRAVGLSPIAQVTALPALSVALALRRESDATPQP